MIRGSVEDFLGTTTIAWLHVKDSPTGTFSITPLLTMEASWASTAARHWNGIVRASGGKGLRHPGGQCA